MHLHFDSGEGQTTLKTEGQRSKPTGHTFDKAPPLASLAGTWTIMHNHGMEEKVDVDSGGHTSIGGVSWPGQDLVKDEGSGHIRRNDGFMLDLGRTTADALVWTKAGKTIYWHLKQRGGDVSTGDEATGYDNQIAGQAGGQLPEQPSEPLDDRAGRTGKEPKVTDLDFTNTEVAQVPSTVSGGGASPSSSPRPSGMGQSSEEEGGGAQQLDSEVVTDEDIAARAKFEASQPRPSCIGWLCVRKRK